VSKVLYSNDIVPGCKFEAHGDSQEEIGGAAADHIASVHNTTDISDKILAMVCVAIHEESSDSHAGGRRIAFLDAGMNLMQRRFILDAPSPDIPAIVRLIPD
jgi:predicted small metal-binding protein